MRRSVKRTVIGFLGVDAKGKWWFLLDCGHKAQRRSHRRVCFCRMCGRPRARKLSGYGVTHAFIDEATR